MSVVPFLAYRVLVGSVRQEATAQITRMSRAMTISDHIG